MSLFRAVLIIFFGSIFFYVTHQLTRFADLSLGINLGVIAFLIFIFGLVLSMPFYFWSERRLKHEPWHDSFFSAAHFGMAYINFLVTFVILRDVFAFIAEYTSKDFDVDVLYNSNSLGIMLVLPLIFILLGTITVRVGPKLKPVTLFFPNLPADLEELRILHITDLHISSSLPLSFVERLVKVANTSKADLVVYTGDILDSQAIRHLSEFELLKQIKAPLGVYYVPGNHEYYWQVDQALAAFRAVGAEVLINDTSLVRKGAAHLQVAGIPDPAALSFQLEGPDFKKLQTQARSDSFRLLLSHQPSFADAACEQGFDLQLSGHTHGGQFFPWNFLIGFFQKYAKGLYRIKNMQLYVNQGTGYWGPSLRLGTYCELTEIVLRKSQK